ncbi:MAG: restriction endonuclease [Kosmotoga sp.]|uniref:restriction endonuclease n=1 Tax=Kosmotoga sp. TaxID=1955248 RepID=UPI0025C5277F|nr:restriction endonuclease [Kosmotoga sp.]MCD6159310.1 restriction endonuclease [Kosmotoga sp.]
MDIDFSVLSEFLLIYVLPPLAVVLAILLFLLYRKRKVMLVQKSMSLIDNLEGKDFERFLLLLFRRLGYNAHLTGRGKDQGADLVIKKRFLRTAVQAKRYSNSVGNAAVQQVYASRKIYNCRKAMVVTNSRFTREARELARKTGVVLWDREKLIRHMVKAGITPKIVGKIITNRADGK